MNQLTLKLINNNTPIFPNQCIQVEVHEKIKDNNKMLIYATMHGIILTNGIQILPENNIEKILLNIKNNTNQTIVLKEKSVIANYLELNFEIKTSKILKNI